MKQYKQRIVLVAKILLFIVVVVALIIYVRPKKVKAPEVADNTNTPTVLSTEGTPAKVSHRVKPVALNTMSYTEAYMKFKDGNIIQFGPACQNNHKSSVVMANGGELMLDNRTESPETITIGDNVYSLAPYDFKIITLNVPNIPTTFLVDCKVAQNVVTLIVE